MNTIIRILFNILLFTVINAEIPSTTVETTVNTAPYEFPKSDQNYNFIYNSSLREELENKTLSQNGTEIDDLLGLDTKSTQQYETQRNPSEVDADLSNKNETEWLQSNGDNTEDKRIEITEIVNKTINVNGDFPLDSNVAAVLAVVFLVISIVGYMTLMSWRQYLERRYGSRQMLVNDDFNDPDDMKHFSI